MPRYKLTIEYDGTDYVGWQQQPNGRSIQLAVEDAAGKLDEAPVRVYGSGRTDSGVHALGQVAHLDLTKNLRTDVVRDGLNHHLGDDTVAILNAERVGDNFHARFSATARHYLYRISDRRPPLTLDRGRIWRIPVKMDVAAMHDAAQCLVGLHDMSTFRDGQCQPDIGHREMSTYHEDRQGIARRHA